jgi:hypothetical protein
MDTATEILVIITSSFLCITLVFGIALMIMLIKLTKKIRQIAEKAEQVVEDAEAATSMFRNAAGPLTIIKTISNIVDVVTKHKRRK